MWHICLKVSKSTWLFSRARYIRHVVEIDTFRHVVEIDTFGHSAVIGFIQIHVK